MATEKEKKRRNKIGRVAGMITAGLFAIGTIIIVLSRVLG